MLDLLNPYKLLACAAIAAASWLHGCHHGGQTATAELAQFQATVKAQGEAAQAAADKQAKADELKKEQADEENTRTIADLRRTAERLRLDRAASGYLPPAPASARSPETACFDRPQLERAIAELDSGLQGITRQGDEARVNLDTTRRWAQPRTE
jgi:hypothetical protein